MWKRLAVLAGQKEAPLFPYDLFGGGMRTQASTNIYIDATLGNDANPGTQAQPFATLQAALNAAPKEVFNDLIFFMAPGTYAGAVVDGFRTHAATPIATTRSQVAIVASSFSVYTPASGTSTGTLTAQTDASGSTLATMTDSTQSWPVNGLVGRFIFISSGTGSTGTVSVPVRYLITSNTATAVTIVGAGTLAGVGSGYILQTPNVFITSPTPTSAVGSGGYTAVTLGAAGLVFAFNQGFFYAVQGIEFTIGTAMPTAVSMGGGRVRFSDCRWMSSTGAVVGLNLNNFCEGTQPIAFQQCHFESSIASVGIQVSTTGGVTPRPSLTLLACSFIGHAQHLASSAHGGNTISGCYFATATTASVTLSGNAINQFSNSRWTGNAIGIRGTATTATGMMPTTFGITTCDLSTNTTAIALTEAGQWAYMGTVTGTGNTTGLSVARGARAVIGSGTTLTGTTEISLDGASQTLAAMRAASPKLLTNTYGSIVYE